MIFSTIQRVILTATATLFFALSSAAANPESDFHQDPASRRKSANVRTEWGLTAAAYYNAIELDGSAAGISLKPTLGYGIGLHMGLKIGNFFAIQPEINYERSTLNITASGVKDNNFKVECSSLDIPVFASLRLFNLVRINAGPVFTVMNNCYYLDSKNEKQLFGSTRPTFGYSAGVAVALLRRDMIDLRYTSYLQSSFYNLEGREFGGKTQTISLKLGYIF